MIKNVVDVLKKTFNGRLTCGNRWMVWDRDAETWFVYEKQYRKSQGVILIETDSEKEAVRELVEDDEIV